MSDRQRGVVYGKQPRADGRWQGYVSLSGGKRRTVIRPTEAEMRRDVDALGVQLAEGREPSTRDPQLGAYLDDWIEKRRDGIIGGRPLAAATVIRYEILVRLQIVPTSGTLRVSRFRPAHIDTLMDALRRAGMSGSTRLQVYRLLHVALKHAERRGLIARNPCDLVDPPPRDPAQPRDLDTDAITAVLHAARGHPQEAMLWVALATGVRQGELFALKLTDVELDAARVTVREKVQHLAGIGAVRSAPKTSAGVRTMSLPAVAVAALRTHLAAQARLGRPNPHGLLFPASNGEHFRAGNWNRNVWERWKADAGVDPKTPFRALTRKAHHSLMVALGVDPETLRHRAGHTSASTTMDWYVQTVSGADEEAARRLDAELRRLASKPLKRRDQA
jgi:integrase